MDRKKVRPGMRDRFGEFLPLLLAAVVLLVFQLARQGSPASLFQTLPEATETPAVNIAVAGQQALPVQRRPTSGTPLAAACRAAQPWFTGGMANQKQVLGPSMGEPLECERAVDAQGNTQQKTTTGLAYYRRQLNLTCFTTGYEHWGLALSGLLHWTGDSVEPPVDALISTR